MRHTLHCAEASQLKEQLPADLQRSMELASEKGASNWLFALPLEKYGFALHKDTFQDAVYLRYGWIPKIFLLIVSVDRVSLLIMHSPALLVASLSSDIMNWEMWLWVCCKKFVRMVVANHTYSNYLGRYSMVALVKYLGWKKIFFWLTQWYTQEWHDKTDSVTIQFTRYKCNNANSVHR